MINGIFMRVNENDTSPLLSRLNRNAIDFFNNHLISTFQEKQKFRVRLKDFKASGEIDDSDLSILIQVLFFALSESD